jgi:hypothetical protein
MEEVAPPTMKIKDNHAKEEIKAPTKGIRKV